MYEVATDWSFHFDGKTIEVPSCYRMDGASVPRFALSLTGLQRDGIHRPEALIHDFIYHYKGKLPSDCFFDKNDFPLYKIIGRKEANDLFERSLLCVGLKSWHVWASRQAVNIGGRFYWNKK